MGSKEKDLRLTMSRFLLLSLVVHSTWLASTVAESTPYLKEILEGRCFSAPPLTNEEVSSKADVCPDLVESIMNVLESNLDAGIGASDFATYLETADFSSPPDSAYFLLRVFGADSTIPTFTPPPGFVAPEDTPGGALLKDLVFCGVDQHENCSIEKSNAYWTFWEAAYSKFSSQVQGHVQIVLEPLADVQFLLRSAISNLHTDAISSVAIYGSNDCASSKEVLLLTESLREAGIDTIICKDDIVDFYLDNRDSTHNDEEEHNNDDEDKQEKYPSRKGGKFAGFLRVLGIVLLAVGCAIFCFLSCTDDKSFGKDRYEAVRNLYMIPYEAVRELWSVARGFFVNKSNNSDNKDEEEIKSENSPLMEAAYRKQTEPGSDALTHKVVSV